MKWSEMCFDWAFEETFYVPLCVGIRFYDMMLLDLTGNLDAPLP